MKAYHDAGAEAAGRKAVAGGDQLGEGAFQLGVVGELPGQHGRVVAGEPDLRGPLRVQRAEPVVDGVERRAQRRPGRLVRRTGLERLQQ